MTKMQPQMSTVLGACGWGPGAGPLLGVTLNPTKWHLLEPGGQREEGSRPCDMAATDPHPALGKPRGCNSKPAVRARAA